MNSFEEGYRFFQKHSGAVFGLEFGDLYVEDVQNAIRQLAEDLNGFDGYNTNISQLKGDVFEFWQSDTFNVNAIIQRSTSRTFVERSTEYGSVDISSNFEKVFGLKAYANAEASAKAQSISIFQKYSEYKSHGGIKSLEDYLTERGFSSDSVINDPVYSGQIRVIPKDQLEEAAKWLRLKIAKESLTRPEQVKRYEDTLEMLTDKLSDGKGVESVSLSKDEAEQLARLAKQGKIDEDLLSEYGVSTEGLMQYRYIMEESFKAGMTAAVISIVLKTAPEIYKAFDYLIKTGEIDLDQFRNIGNAALTGSAEGFIKGTISAALTATCKSGLFGELLKEVQPGVIGAAVTIMYNTTLDSIRVARGEMSRSELTNNLLRDTYISAVSMVLGGIAQGAIEIPYLGFMVGSFLGSVLGSFTYDLSQKAVLSFCVDSGFTMFGLVDQNYQLPDHIIKELGIDTFNYETFDPETFNVDSFVPDSFEFDTFHPDSLNVTYLRRGVIGVSKVGYIN